MAQMAMKQIAKNKSEFSDLTVILWTGGYLVGKMEGGNKLLKPRILEPTQDGRIHMRPPLGLPPFIILNHYLGSYKISLRDKELIELYEKVTNPNVDPGV